MKKLATALLCVLLGVTCTSAFSACKDNGPTSDSSGGKPPVVVDSNPTVVGGGDTFYFFAETGKDLEFTMSMKGGSFQSLKRGDALLTRDTDYTWSTSREILAIKHSYLSSLAEGEYSFTFTTSLGSCELAVSVGPSNVAAGYPLQFADPAMDTASMAPMDHFFSKISRDDEAVTFHFVTFGDFDREEGELEFINILINNEPYSNKGYTWCLTENDLNVRVFSDGQVIYKDDFTGEEQQTTPPGKDNIWWATVREPGYENYKTEGVENTTIIRQGGVTSFSVAIPYSVFGITKDDSFRFAMMECSEFSQRDFNLYAHGYCDLNGKRLQDPAIVAGWPMCDKEGNIVRPEDIVDTDVPADYKLNFAKNKDDIYAKISPAEEGGAVTGVTFDFWTKGDFDTEIGGNGNPYDEFINIYLDLPTFNNDGLNWHFVNNQDVNIRIYRDGKVYFKNVFPDKNGQTNGTDNIWYTREGNLTDADLLFAAPIAIDTSAKGVTTFGITVSFEKLGLTAGNEAFRFFLAEASDNSTADFNYYGGDLSYEGTKAATNDSKLTTWPLYNAGTGKITLAGELPAAPVFTDKTLTIDPYRQESNSLTIGGASDYSCDYELADAIEGVSLDGDVLSAAKTVANGTKVTINVKYFDSVSGYSGTLSFGVTISIKDSTPEAPAFTGKVLAYDVADKNAVKSVTLAPDAGAYEHYRYTYAFTEGTSHDGFSLTADGILTSAKDAAWSGNVSVTVTYTDTENASAPARTVTFTVAVTVSNSAVAENPPTFSSDLKIAYDVFTAEESEKKLELSPLTNPGSYTISYTVKGAPANVSLVKEGGKDILRVTYTAATEKTLTIVAAFEENGMSYTVEFFVAVKVEDSTPPAFEQIELNYFKGQTGSLTIVTVADNDRYELTYALKESVEGISLTADGVLTGRVTALNATPFTVVVTCTDTLGKLEDKKIEVNGAVNVTEITFSFSEGADPFKVYADRTAEGITFNFTTTTGFGSELEFVSIFIDKMMRNDSINWNLGAEDYAVRIYHDGKAYIKTGFDINQADPWWESSKGHATSTFTPLGDVAMKIEGDVKTFSVTLTNAQLGITENTEKFRFLMREWRERGVNDHNCDLIGDNMAVNRFEAQMDHNSAAWAIFDLKNDKIGFDGKMFEYADADISFGYGVRRDSFTVDMERVNGGVRFNFATNGAFGYENNNLEFVNIYLDMSKTTDGINWNFQNGKDINVRIYSDGTVYYRRNWSGAADELFWRLDHATYQYKLDGVAISHVNGVTTFSLTLTDEFLWGEEGTPESFRFQFRECADNDVNFNLYGGHTKINGTQYGGDHDTRFWATYDPQTNGVMKEE